MTDFASKFGMALATQGLAIGGGLSWLADEHPEGSACLIALCQEHYGVHHSLPGMLHICSSHRSIKDPRGNFLGEKTEAHGPNSFLLLQFSLSFCISLPQSQSVMGLLCWCAHIKDCAMGRMEALVDLGVCVCQQSY